MALTSQQIITRAFRALNITPIGKEPTTAELNEGLGNFQSLVSSLFGLDIGNLLQPWETPPSPVSALPGRFPLLPESQNMMSTSDQIWSNPPPNARLITNAGIGIPIYFPPTPSNGAQMALVNVGADFVTSPLTLSGNGRLIEGVQQLVLSAPLTAPIRWLYRDDLANWVRFSDLALASVSPLPEAFDDFLICAMALWTAGPNGVDVPKTVSDRAKRGHALLKATYQQYTPGATFPGAFRFQTYQSYGAPWNFGGPGSF